MTAVPIPRTIPMCPDEDDDDENLFSVKDITKNLEKDFATPQVIQRHINRLSNQAYVAGSTFMKVYLRVRPFTDEELRNKENQKCIAISDDRHDVIVRAPKSSNMFKNSAHGVGETCHSFSFTKIFNEDVGQKDFFDGTALPVVQDFISGQNSLIFTYGVTSSGKTHTIQGCPGNEGIMPRSVDVIFNSIGNQIMQDSEINLQMNNKVVLVSDEEKEKLLEEKMNLLLLADRIKENEGIAKDSLDPQTDTSVGCSSSAETSANETKSSSRLSFLDFTKDVADESYVDLSDQGPVKFAVFVSFTEIYMDYIYDLLQPLPKGKKKKRPACTLAEEKSIPFVKDLRQIQVTTREEVFKLLTVARNNLHMAETKLNHNSSRSHCIFTIKTVCMTDIKKSLSARVSQISFCDLAGSERWGKTNSFGERLKEAGKINNSLMTLGKCIETLRHNQQHGKNQQRVVPYRESRLTRLFQGFLMGHGRACMIVNANQCASMFDETFHVLKFSAIASEVKMDKNPIRKSQRISRRSSRDNLRVSLEQALTRKSTRKTCGWQPQETTIREEGNDEDEEEGDESESEGESGEESDDEVTAFWRAREEKLLLCITMFKEALKQEKEKVYQREFEIRQELTEEMTKHFADIDEKWEERLDRRVEVIENYNEKRYNTAVDYANNKIDNLVKERDDALKDVGELEDECEELEKKADKLEEEYTELKKESSEKISYLESEFSKLQSRCKELEEGLVAQGTKDVQPRHSSADASRESLIENLQQENSDGREIIQEQLREMEDMRAMIENLEEEKQQLLEKNKGVSQKLKAMEGKTQDADKISQLTQENGKLEAHLLEIRSECEFLKNEAKSHQDEYIHMEETSKNSKAEIAKLNEKLSKMNEDLGKNMSQLEAKQKDSQCIKLQLEAKDLELKQAKEDLKTATSNKAAFLDELKQAQSEKSEALFKVGSLEVELTSTSDKLAKASADLGAAKEKVCELELIAEENKEIVIVETSELKAEVENISAKNTALMTTLEEAVSCAEMKNKEIANLKEEVQKSKEKEEELEVKLAKIEREHARNLKNAEKENQREVLKLEAKVASEREELMKLRKDLDSASRLETQLIAEVDRLQEKLNQASVEKANASNIEEKRMSLNVELERDVKILTSERDDLLKKTTELSVELSHASSKLREIQESQPTMSVAEASELEILKQKLRDTNNKHEKQEIALQECKDEVKTQQDTVVELQKRLQKEAQTFRIEKEELLQKNTHMEKELAHANTKLQNLQEIQDSRAAADASELEKLRHKLEEMSEMQMEQQKQVQEHQVKEADQQEKLVDLENRLQEAVKSKEEELQKFREGRDKIAAALDVKINSQNACNQMLKDKLDDQIIANVQLKSENSRLQAELQMQKKAKQQQQHQQASSTLSANALRKSTSASAIQPVVKQEPLSPKEVVESPMNKLMEEVTVQDMSTNMDGTPLKKPEQIKAEPPTKPAEQDTDEVPAKRKTRSTRGTNGRTAVVKKTSSRRKKVAERPSTPVPTDFPDDSRQSRGFPQPEIEMDVTPVLKKSTRGRKRTKASKEEPNKLDTESLADENELGRRTRSRRGKAAAETSDEGDTASLNKFKNISKMGDMLKNSPVGQALKRFEAAISPSRSPTVISSPAQSTFSFNDQNRQSTRRVRKLHAEDISLPLESTPNENDAIGAAGRGVGVLAPPQEPGTRRLRRRK